MTDTLVKPSNPKNKKLKVASANPTFTCGFCSKEYKREDAFLTHICEKKRRHLEADVPHVVAGFTVYQAFHKANYANSKPKSYADFCDSKFYTAFVRFGRHLQNINAINPKDFVQFLIRSKVPISDWEKSIVYDTYVRELNKKESPDAAIQRNIMLMQQWANDTGEHWTDFFRKIAPAQAVLWIKSGRISPWVFYIASSAGEMLERMSEEQINIIEKHIDTKFWEVKLRFHKDEVQGFKTLFDEAGL